MALTLEELLGLTNPDPLQQLASDLVDEHEDLLDQLVAIRREHYTQEAIAKRMGVTQSAVARIESGERDPRLSTLRRYALAIRARITHTVTNMETPKLTGDPGRWKKSSDWISTRIVQIPASASYKVEA